MKGLILVMVLIAGSVGHRFTLRSARRVVGASEWQPRRRHLLPAIIAIMWWETRVDLLLMI
jgi:hypothetical protein